MNHTDTLRAAIKILATRSTYIGYEGDEYCVTKTSSGMFTEQINGPNIDFPYFYLKGSDIKWGKAETYYVRTEDHVNGWRIFKIISEPFVGEFEYEKHDNPGVVMTSIGTFRLGILQGFEEDSTDKKRDKSIPSMCIWKDCDVDNNIFFETRVDRHDYHEYHYVNNSFVEI